MSAISLVTAGTPRQGRGRASGRRTAPATTRIAGPVLWTICLALTLAGIGALPTLGSHDATGACRLVAVQVQPSESLWSLAAAHPEPGLSTAAVVDRIARLNALADARLHPGQRLVLPLSTAGGHALAQLGSSDSSH